MAIRLLATSGKAPTDPRVPSDLLAGYGGGISLKQYEQIKGLPGINVAAPIAYVGYMQMPVPAIYFSDHSYPTGYYQLDWKLTAFNGQRQIVETRVTYIFYLIASSTSTDSASDSAEQPPPDPLAVFGSQLSESQSETGNPLYDPGLHKAVPYVQIPMLLHRSLPGHIALDDGPMTAQQILDFSSASAPAGLSYRSAKAPDGSSAYTLIPQGTQGGETTFRDVTYLHLLKTDNVMNPGGPDAFYEYQAVGEFTDNGLATQINNPLNWLPENTYAVPPVTLRYDALGHPVTPTTFLPTTNPAGFVMQPPLALTTIAAARELVGDRSISAIRVRVAGVVTPTQESWKHIQQVAQEIRQHMHLQVHQGEFIAITGSSGSGKTTLFSLLGALDSPDSGEIWLDEIAVHRLRGIEAADFRRQQVGFVFQLFYLLPNRTALENVMAPLLPFRRKLDFDLKQRAKELLQSVGLGDRLGHPPEWLSGGEQQRVAIAHA